MRVKSARVKSARVNSARSSQSGHIAFNNKNARIILFMCFIKNIQQKFEGIMFGFVKSTGGNVVRGDQKLCKRSPYESFQI